MLMASEETNADILVRVGSEESNIDIVAERGTGAGAGAWGGGLGRISCDEASVCSGNDMEGKEEVRDDGMSSHFWESSPPVGCLE